MRAASFSLVVLVAAKEALSTKEALNCPASNKLKDLIYTPKVSPMILESRSGPLRSAYSATISGPPNSFVDISRRPTKQNILPNSQSAGDILSKGRYIVSYNPPIVVPVSFGDIGGGAPKPYEYVLGRSHQS